jgi:hypothetical protein
MSTILAPAFFAISNTLFGFAICKYEVFVCYIVAVTAAPGWNNGQQPAQRRVFFID